jgi:VWFA-related protein
MQIMFRRIALSVSLCMLVIGPTSIPAQQDYEVAVTYVSVWVKAVDNDGNAIESLSMEDFEVFEDGVPVQITCFDEIKIDEAATTAAAGKQTETDPVAAERFVVYLDLLNTMPREYQAIKPGLKQFLSDISKRNAEVMLAGLMPNHKLGIIAPFTKDFNRLNVLIDQAPANATRDSVQESRIRELTRKMENAGDDVVDALRDGYATARSFANADRDTSMFTLSALESFAAHMATQDFGGHLIMLYVSGGFSSDPGRQYFEIVDGLAQDSVQQEDMLQFSMDRSFNFDFRKEMQKSIGKLNRLNVTISTLDTQGLGSSSEYRESLQQVAYETGGIAISNSQNFKAGFKTILQDFEHQYILCYTPPPKKKETGYHKIKVVSKKSGIKLRYRQGYSE